MGSRILRSLGIILFALPAAAQPLSYTLLPAEGVQPSARFDGTIAYDPPARQIYLFGGQDSAPRNDLWVYSLARRQWSEIPVAGARPAARFGHTLVFDSVRRRLVVFGGQASGFFSDVWAFDIGRGEWQQLSRDEAGPSRRYGHSAIYETARDRMVISHGFTDAGRFDDTWAFEFAVGSWRNISPQGTRPLRRCLHHAVYDEANEQMWLYGGCSSGFGPCPQGDLWSFDLSSNRWTERTVSPRPSGREHYGMTYDSVRRRLVLFGGNSNGALNDTWEFDAATSSWRQSSLQGPPPGPRHRHESVYAADRGVSFFFGGITTSGMTNELWMLGAGFVTARPQIAPGGIANAFSGMGGAVSPGEIVSITGSGLGPIEGIALAADPQTGRLPVSGPGVSVEWNGIAAPIYYARADQLNVQVPYEVAGSTEARVKVTVNGQTSEEVTLPVSATHPGLLPMVWNQDGTMSSAANASAAGDIVTLFATGQGVTNPPSPSGVYPVAPYPEPVAPVSLRIGGVEAEILFRGQAPGAVGVMQINARVPAALSGGAVPVVLAIGAAESQAGVTLSVR